MVIDQTPPRLADADNHARLVRAFSPGQRWRYGWIWAAIWLVYLAPAMLSAWREPDLARRVTGVAALALFAAGYLAVFYLVRSRRLVGQALASGVTHAVIAASVALAVVAFAAVGEETIGLLVYLAVLVMFLYPSRVAWPAVIAILGASWAVPAALPGWRVIPLMSFQIAVAATAMWGVTQMISRNAQLAAAHEEIARLAVADERNRFARDLHDILGHSLTVVAVKAELAGRLVHADPARAEVEIGDVERLAREALADVRTAVAGYREVTLAGELASARSALAAAGIEADLPHAIDEVPAERRELYGWTVREAVTNVVRHSGATRCRIRITAQGIEISDDGCGPDPDSRIHPGGPLLPARRERPGHGLLGLSERVREAGGSLSIARSAEGGFNLRVQMSEVPV